MNRLDIKLKDLKQTGRKALVAFVTAGYPSLSETVKIVRDIETAGADIIELGVPFSDPIADGPTIQASSEKALRNGATLGKILKIVEAIRRNSDIPILLMGYLNPFTRHGVSKTMKAVKASGVDGLIIPDVTIEEGGFIKAETDKNDLSLVQFVAPNTPQKRMKTIDHAADSFVYVVSITGVTGKRAAMPSQLQGYLASTGKEMRHMRFMGFGISGPEQVRAYKGYVDGVIIGSALVNIIEQNKSAAKRSEAIQKFILSIRSALDA